MSRFGQEAGELQAPRLWGTKLTRSVPCERNCRMQRTRVPVTGTAGQQRASGAFRRASRVRRPLCEPSAVPPSLPSLCSPPAPRAGRALQGAPLGASPAAASGASDSGESCRDAVHGGLALRRDSQVNVPEISRRQNKKRFANTETATRAGTCGTGTSSGQEGTGRERRCCAGT